MILHESDSCGVRAVRTSGSFYMDTGQSKENKFEDILILNKSKF